MKLPDGISLRAPVSAQQVLDPEEQGERVVGEEMARVARGFRLLAWCPTVVHSCTARCRASKRVRTRGYLRDTYFSESQVDKWSVPSSRRPKSRRWSVLKYHHLRDRSYDRSQLVSLHRPRPNRSTDHASIVKRTGRALRLCFSSVFRKAMSRAARVVNCNTEGRVRRKRYCCKCMCA